MSAQAPAPADYDGVAALYARAFRDIRERRDEWRWLTTHWAQAFGSRRPRVLDLGCGTGALLHALGPRMQSGVGVDISTGMLEQARRALADHPHVSLQAIGGSALPFAEASFDCAISFLSFRYLDRDASMAELCRVLAPGGHLFVVDMVAARPGIEDVGVLTRSALAHALRPLRQARFTRDVQALTADASWKRMLAAHPLVPLAEYRACFERWFPGRGIETLTTTWNKRVIAFDSGPLVTRHST